MSNSFRRISLLNPDAEYLREDLGAKAVSFFVRNLPVFIDQTLIDEMKQVAINNHNRNVRVCLHSAVDAQHHDMLILEHIGRYFAPHRHHEKAETFHVIEGELGIVSYNEDGDVVEAGILGPKQIYRLAIQYYHFLTPMTDIVIYHESKPGPFVADKDVILPKWKLPDPNDQKGTSAFVQGVYDLLRNPEDGR